MKAIKETILHSQKVYDGYFLKIQRDEVLLPNGRKATREFILHPGASMVIPLVDDDHVVMIKQYRHANGRIFLEFPAGKKDAGESGLETAHRELQEETGYTTRDMRFLTTIHPVIGYANEHIDIYFAKDLQKGEARPDQGEFVEVVNVAIKDLMPMIIRGELTDVKTQLGVFWLEKVIQKNW